MPNQPKTPGHTIRVPDDEWLPAKALAAKTGETMTDIVRRALRQLVSTTVLGSMLVVGAMSGARVGDPVQIGVCHDTAKCAAVADTSVERAAMIAQQVNTFGCQPVAKGVVPARALVLDARTVGNAAEVGGVVKAESFDAAFAHAKAGTAWVVRWCA
jgi:hypothetical protein